MVYMVRAEPELICATTEHWKETVLRPVLCPVCKVTLPEHRGRPMDVELDAAETFDGPPAAAYRNELEIVGVRAGFLVMRDDLVESVRSGCPGIVTGVVRVAGITLNHYATVTFPRRARCVVRAREGKNPWTCGACGRFAQTACLGKGYVIEEGQVPPFGCFSDEHGSNLLMTPAHLCAAPEPIRRGLMVIEEVAVE